MFANTYHLMLHPGADVVGAAGGLHAFMGRQRPLITDSGGFQARLCAGLLLMPTISALHGVLGTYSLHPLSLQPLPRTHSPPFSRPPPSLAPIHVFRWPAARA